MLEGSVKVVNPLGLHARAAAQLVRVAGQFRSDITLRREDSAASANAKSILSLLALAAPIGTELSIQANGPDEREGLAAVTALFAGGFGEI
ncbi:MAG TPA: HPr family phosphocarrier protein [Pyrinomonadaceae bacterium]|nr:HPr family phosphocarrier protein [Pyrinomonadaceae bacterium]